MFKYLHIKSQADLLAFCTNHSDCQCVAFDTEFVSEHTYEPELCLIQVWADGESAIIDPLACGDPQAFWEWIVGRKGETIVHAGREELLFCLRATKSVPCQLFDVQIGAGLIGLEYPAGYGNLVSRLTGKTPYKGETRTDWRKRPLTPNQLRYAIEDVAHLSAMKEGILQRLNALGRVSWWVEEMGLWEEEIKKSLAEKAARRVPRASGLSGKSLAVARELSLFREEEAKRRDRPARQILRDDLLLELAKRQSPDPARIRSIRGMERRGLQELIAQLSSAITRGLEKADDEASPPRKVDNFSQLNLIGQFLASALGSICKSAELAPNLVGTATDVRELAAHHLGLWKEGAPPLLATGWRKEVVGKKFEELLSGELCIRITEPLSEHPLSFVKSPE